MRDEIRIRLSVGLIALAALHAVLLGVVFSVLHSRAEPAADSSWKLPTPDRPVAPQVGQIEKLQEPQQVNLSAQGELKQQCPPTTRPYRIVRPYRVVPSTPTIPAPAAPPRVTPTTAPSTTPAPIVVTPTPTIPASSSKPAPARKRYQIALFVGNDAKSRRLVEWFEDDPRLAKLKAACEFQVYTQANALYRTRYQDIVPVDQFPVVLFQDADGGHVHAAGHTMLPSTADELYGDLQHGYELYQQTRQAQRTGALKTRGYSWDDAISPTLQLTSQDCPDGYCPVQPSDSWRPFDRNPDSERDRLFDRVKDERNALLWAGAGELATLALIFVAVILLGFILIKRGM